MGEDLATHIVGRSDPIHMVRLGDRWLHMGGCGHYVAPTDLGDGLPPYGVCDGCGDSTVWLNVVWDGSLLCSVVPAKDGDA